jgi:hypothetical protein
MGRNETHGDKFEAIGLENKMEIIKESLENSIVAEKYIYEIPVKNEKIIPLLYPKQNFVQICSLILSNNSGEQSAESFFPILEGIENEFIIEDKITWNNEIEGEIEVTSEDGNIYSFFAPYYLHDFSKFNKGDKITVSLSGLAFFIEDTEIKYEIDKGSLYEMELKTFL